MSSEQVTPLRVAAVQMEAEVGNLDANLSMCEALADGAGRDGAEWIVLPEFFASGTANRPEIRDAAPLADGEPAQLLRDLARRHGAHVGGSAIVRDSDGHTRNAFLLASPNGDIVGRHDKDLATMWENRLYVGGGDPGRIDTGGLTVGVALCWEMMRTQTVERLAGRVDLVLAGSGWWSIPLWWPKQLFRHLQAENERRALGSIPAFAPFIGAPVVHAAHSGTFNCPWPLSGAVYHGHYAGGAMLVDATGEVLAARHRAEGPGWVVGDVHPSRTPTSPAPEGFWLQERGEVAAACWGYQGPLGRRQYRRAHHRRSAGVAAVEAAA